MAVSLGGDPADRVEPGCWLVARSRNGHPRVGGTIEAVSAAKMPFKTADQQPRTIAQWLISSDAELTPAERRVARALLANYPAAGLDTVASLAQIAGVSDPTVIRFAKAAGFDSFRAFQQALRAELSGREASALSQARSRTQQAGKHVPQAVGGSHDGDGESSQVRAQLADAVHATLESLPETELQLAVSFLTESSRRVFAYGGDYTGVAAQQLVLQLAPLRPGVRLAAANTALIASDLGDTSPGDVWCIFDVRRYHERAQHVATTARQRGAKVVLFTDAWLSPAAQHADVVLTAAVAGPGAMDTIVPMVAVVELVCALAEHGLGSTAIERLDAVEPIRTQLSARASDRELPSQ